jgi:NADH-quinone oxidoreductase subunit G/NADP-reducing hydrogenase subunit HndD
MNMLTIEINGKKLEASKGETILTVARRNGIDIPTLCHMEGLTPSGACRMCVVDVEGFPNLLTACSYPVNEGMKVKTHSPRALETRRTIVQLLLANHPDDCLYCARSSDCDLQGLARDLGISRREYHGFRAKKNLDVSGPSLVRDPEKCILCGKCVRVCEDVQSVSAIDFVGRGSKTVIGTAFQRGLATSSCINCGQCAVVCPTGALVERNYVPEVLAALRDPDKYVVVQHAPAVSVTLAEEFGVPPGSDCDGQMVAALRRAGFKRVFDTSFSADLTIMEEGSELVHRITNGGVLPMFTSCSPGWIKFMETFYPDMLPHLSTCKSPQQMLGAVVKSYFAEREKIDPAKIVSVSIMPCTAKKFEAGRPEMSQNYVQDVDYVLTTREAGLLLRMSGVGMMGLEPEAPDTPFGERSTAGKIFGASGGVMEAAVRSAHFLITGKELPNLDIQPLRGLDGAKELKANIGGVEVGAAVVSGLGNARALLEQIRAGRKDLHFIEVMTCPGGCINGGGQPLHSNKSAVMARMKKLYNLDKESGLRVSHDNQSVKRLYKEFLGAPLGEKSHHLLHTHYAPREVLV